MSTQAERDRAYYLKNREKIRERRKAQRAANPEADRAKSRAYYLANKDRVRERQNSYYEANRERIQDQQQEYRTANAEAAVERVREWRKANPDKYAVLAHLRRVRVATDADLTPEQWREIMLEFDGHCAYCDRDDLPLIVEHMTPLSRGGRHTASNVAPACQPCNARKHAKTAPEFAGWEIPPRRLALLASPFDS